MKQEDIEKIDTQIEGVRELLEDLATYSERAITSKYNTRKFDYGVALGSIRTRLEAILDKMDELSDSWVNSFAE